jgi:hypothetical protein
MRRFAPLTMAIALLLVLAPAVYADANNANANANANAGGNGADPANASGDPAATQDPGTAADPAVPEATGEPQAAETGGDPSQSAVDAGQATDPSTAAAAPVPVSSAVSAPDPAATLRAAIATPQANGPAGKTTICHRTGSATNPFVIITVSNNALPAHRAHGDVLPSAAGACAATNPPPPKPGKTTICHRTGSATNPFVIITVSDNALPAHFRHGDRLPGPSGGCADSVQPPNPPSGNNGGGSGGNGAANTNPNRRPNRVFAVNTSNNLVASEQASGGRTTLPFTGINAWLLMAIGLGLTGLGIAGLRMSKPVAELSEAAASAAGGSDLTSGQGRPAQGSSRSSLASLQLPGGTRRAMSPRPWSSGFQSAVSAASTPWSVSAWRHALPVSRSWKSRTTSQSSKRGSPI